MIRSLKDLNAANRRRWSRDAAGAGYSQTVNYRGYTIKGESTGGFGQGNYTIEGFADGKQVGGTYSSMQEAKTAIDRMINAKP